MHIAVLTKGGESWLGGSTYVKSLVYALDSLRNGNRHGLRIMLVVTPGSDSRSFRELEGVADRIVDANSIMKPYSLGNRVRWKLERTFGSSINPRVEEFLLSENVDFAYPCRVNKKWLPRLKSAEWIPDFQYDHYPEGSNPEEIEDRKTEFRYIAENVPCIVLSSQSAEKDCLRLFPIAKGKTFVLHFRVWFPTEHLRLTSTPVLTEYNLPERFFLVSNLFAPTKNHIMIFKALKQLQQEGIFPTVVCTGSLHDYRNPDFASTILRSISQHGVAGQVRLLGIIPRPQQIQLMRHAVAVIQPSLFEGWNTSVEEAHCLGKDLIVSDIPVHREQNPPRAFFFDPLSSAELAHIMKRMWEQIPGGTDIKREGQALQQYSGLVHEFAKAILKLANQNGFVGPREC